ncbi:MAG TPA: hypothetical protein VLK28_00205 [Methylomirabilota bacterium]|nr:hypothetical protein [Methylomirabilota bacterium]
MDRERRQFVIGLAAVASLLATASFAQGPPPAGKGRGPRWDQEAEQTFRMGRGTGRQLMTEEEWKEHRAKMRSMSAEERARYREEVHKRMVERAKDKGVTIPDTPGPRSPKGPGPR